MARGGGRGGGRRGGSRGGGLVFTGPLPDFWDVYDPTADLMYFPATTNDLQNQQQKLLIHGDVVGAVGNTSECEPNFGTERTGMQEFSGMNNALSESTGGVDPFALASFGTEDNGDADEPGMDLGVPDELGLARQLPWGQFEEMTVQDFDYDPWTRGRQRAAYGNDGGRQATSFGFDDDMYSGFGPAPLMGGEGS